MKRFLLFAGYVYYPVGGWSDFKGSFDSLEEALKAASESTKDWKHIVDTTKNEIVWNREL